MYFLCRSFEVNTMMSLYHVHINGTGNIQIFKICEAFEATKNDNF